jgi:ATP-binding cassette subfamily B protein
LITPIFTQIILDRVIVQGSTVTLFAMGLGLVIFGIFGVAITGLRTYLLDHTANRIDVALITGFIRHTLSLPLSYFDSRYVGDIISRVEENRKIQRFLSGEALSILLDFLTIFIYLGVMFKYSWKLALLALIVVPPFFLLALIYTPFLQRISREIFKKIAKESSYLIEILTGIRTVKSTATEQSVRGHWEGLLGEEVKKHFSGQIIGNQMQIISNLIETLATTGLLWFGAYLVIENQLTIGQLIAFNMLFANIISPFQRLTILWNQFQEVNIAVERLNDVFQVEPEENLQSQSYQSIPIIHGNICFDKVTFRYNPENQKNTLENLSFEIPSGQTIALVGRSGSGKTTIAKLLLGLYTPNQGKILIDGYDIATLSLKSVRQQIGIVDQDSFLFGASIRENISLDNPNINLEDVIQSAKLAGIHEFIKSLPMGYETHIGEGGGLLSGGQRQRIAIARALINNPKILILDEATSHLDTESEQIIQTNLHTIRQNRTIFIIAHRLSTIRNSDMILVLDKGVLIESGNHEELMAKSGLYYHLNHQQVP